MSKLARRNPGLPEDEAVAQEFVEALEALCRVMTKADRQGLLVGFNGIQRNPSRGNAFEPVEPYVNKKLIA